MPAAPFASANANEGGEHLPALVVLRRPQSTGVVLPTGRVHRR